MIRRFFGAIGALLFAGILYPSAAFADLPVDAPAAAPADVAQAGPLSDVPLNSWAYDAVNQLAKDGIIKGYPDGTFKGQRPMTRYEAAVLAYRAVDFLEAQITAGKAVDAKMQRDIDAANKLIQSFGDQLKAVQTHVAALQKEADATQTQVAAQKRQIGALQAFDRRAYIKFNAVYRQFAYGGNVNANCSPLGTVMANSSATSVQTYCNHTYPGNALLPGARTAGYGPSIGDTPPSQQIANGQHNQGMSFNYMKLSFTGTPSANTAFLVELSNTTRASSNAGSSSTTGYCQPQQNYLNGNSAEPSALTNCGSTAAQASYSDGEPGFLASMNNVWFQQSIPNSGLYLRVGHVQNNEGPMASGWLGGDYYWGAQFGMTKGPFNAYVGYGKGNSASTNLLLDNIPDANNKLTVEADYTFHAGKSAINVGGMYNLYTGSQMTEWDPSAVICTSATATRYFANTAAVPFTSCGAGFSPISYTNGAPVTGAYLSPQANNPTITAGGSFITPGLPINQTLSWVGAHVVFESGQWNLALAGSYHLGNDPFTGTGFVGPLTGYYSISYGPAKGGRDAVGKFVYESKGFAAQFNGLGPDDNYFGGPSLYNSWNTNPSGLYFIGADVRYWTSPVLSIALGYGHEGLLPNTTLPAGGATCPGCVVSGFNQNAGYLEMNLGI